jgi:hypothetical protein
MEQKLPRPTLGPPNLAEGANHFSTAPQKDEQPHVAGSDSINCICGYSFDDGFSIACDDCSRWCHAACFQIIQGGVPEEWKCWVCAPRPIDRERAVRLQTQRKQDAIRAENENRRRLGTTLTLDGFNSKAVKLEAQAQTREAEALVRDTEVQFKNQGVGWKEREPHHPEENVRQALEEAERLESNARQAEASAKMHEVSAQKKDIESRIKKAELWKLELKVQDREAKVHLREEEVSKNEEKVRRL